MNTHSILQGRFRLPNLVRTFLFVPILMSLGGCMMLMSALDETEPEAPPKPRIETRHLEIGETVEFVVPSTDEWEYSPYSAYYDEKLRIEIHEDTPLPPNVIRYRIGDFLQTVTARNQEFRVSRPGPIDFRIDPDKLFGYGGEIIVVITRVE